MSEDEGKIPLTPKDFLFTTTPFEKHSSIGGPQLEENEKDVYEDEFIKYEFSDEERREIATSMARLVNDQAAWEDEKKQVMNDLKARGDQLEAGIRSAATKLNNGWEMRRMRCKVIRDYDDGMIRWVRPDTFDTVKERRMTADERQMQIPTD